MDDLNAKQVEALLEAYLSRPNVQTETRLLRKMHGVGRWAVRHWTDEIDHWAEPERWLRCQVLGEIVSYLENIFHSHDLFAPFDPAWATFAPRYVDVLAEEADILIAGINLLGVVRSGFRSARTLNSINADKGKKVEGRLKALRKMAIEAIKKHPGWEDGAVRAYVKHKDREAFGVPYTTAWRDAFRRLKLPPRTIT